MRILFITNYAFLYGANRSLLSLMEYFSKQGENVCLLLPKEGDLSHKLLEDGLQYIRFPYFASLFIYKKDWTVLQQLVMFMLKVMTLLMFPFLLIRIWWYRPNLIYSNSNADNLGLFFAKILRVNHVSHIRDFMDLDHGMFFIGGNEAKRKFINKSDAVIYVSRTFAEHIQMSKQLPPNHTVIYNGVKNITGGYTEKNLSKQINLGIVGLLVEGKGQHLAITYLKSVLVDYPNTMLHIWGDKEGPYKKKLCRLVEQLELGTHVIFHGFEKNTDIIYQEMDALLMFSRMEGFGRVTVEAMQRGIPVIGFNSGGTSEIVKNGFNGYLFKSEEEFLDVFKELFSSNDHYKKISHQAYVDAQKNYSEEMYAKNVFDYLNSLKLI
jgi:glycosyltransferase involved in cell wall biosynthesis